jgi:hypothetical protein
MPTLITQDEFETELLHNLNLILTMAIPVAQIPKKKFKQLTMRNEVAPTCPPLKLEPLKFENEP